MTKFILRLYDWLHCRQRFSVLLLLLSTALLGCMVLHIHYKEDITDFLPLSNRDQDAMRIYQNISGANRIIALIGLKDTTQTDPDRIVEAVDAFANQLYNNSGIDSNNIVSQMDLDRASNATDFVYANIPYFLTTADYARMDSLLADDNYITAQLHNDKQMLLFPSGGLLTDNIGRDPLNLFTPVVQRLSGVNASANYELYDGYIFMPDMKRAIAVINSPYGSSETEHNGELVDRIRSAAKKVEQNISGISITLTGGPVIAVGNSTQIKTDSTLSVAIAVVLILLLLAFTIRNWWNILLIAVSIAWGWLFAIAGLSLVHNDISLIVIGISSVILGIAINYPLHLIAHLTHTPDIRKALREIIMPLLIGNITTIGAFLALVPLRSIALRDLGLFAAFLLMGTIVFVFVFLPQLVRMTTVRSQPVLNKISNVRTDRRPWVIIVVALLTIVFGFFSTRTGFDTNLSHINYLSAEQQADLDYLFGQQKQHDDKKEIYVVSTGKTLNEAFESYGEVGKKLSSLCRNEPSAQVSGCGQFVFSAKEQRIRLAKWNEFVARHKQQLMVSLPEQAAKSGFAGNSFSDFYAILQRQYTFRQAGYFSSFLQSAFPSSVIYDKNTHTYNVIDVVSVPSERLKPALQAAAHGIDDASHYHFEIGKLNSTVANSLSDNFNYIGLACGFIVFFFLWFSMGNIELALLSFLPMAVSWAWILGLMGMLHIDFNIVNIILATFIFGQGDDYTIFITEGCQYEYTYGKKMLASYKNSIIISALIMFFGIGSLIIAKHPALHSLAVVTIIGMFSVVLMAMILPPFIFQWIVSWHGELRHRPLTLKNLLRPSLRKEQCESGREPEYYRDYVRSVYYYCGVDIVKTVKRSLADYEHKTKSTTTDGQTTITVAPGSYGSVALMAALMHPKATIVAQTADEDDFSVCKTMACRVAKNIKTVEPS